MRRVIIAACVIQTGVVFACVAAEPWLAFPALMGLGALAVGLMPE